MRAVAFEEVLARHRLATLGDVLRWAPDGSVHQFLVDNIAAIFEDLGHVWPPESVH